MTVEQREPILHNSAFRAGRNGLMIQRCTVCGHFPNFPRVACPHCFGELTWRRSPGKGAVASFTAVHRPQHERFTPYVPIVMALIALDEGSELIATIVGEERFGIAIGSRVRVAANGWSSLPQFEPVGIEEVQQ
jgi:uncharacterized OB-fold protein